MSSNEFGVYDYKREQRDARDDALRRGEDTDNKPDPGDWRDLIPSSWER